MAKRRSSRSLTAFAVLGVTALVGATLLGLRAAGWLERFELAAYDHFMRRAVAGPEEDPYVTFVEVTEHDIQKIGGYPLSDRILARTIEAIGAHGARAIGIDIYRDLPVAPGSEELDAVLLGSPRVVFLSRFADETSPAVGPPKVLEGSQQVGFNNVLLDGDGIVRRGLLFMEDEAGEVGTSFALLMALFYLGDEGIYAEEDAETGLLRIGATLFDPVTGTTGSYADVDAGGVQFLVDHRGSAGRLPAVTLTALLEGEVDPALLRDRIAVVGLSADSVPDRLHIAIESGNGSGVALPGAATHGYLTSQLVRYARGEGSPIRGLADWQEAALVCVLALIGALAGFGSRSIPLVTAAGLGGALGLWFLGNASMQAGVWLPVVPAGLGFLASLSAVTAYGSSRERAERAELMSLFSRHVAPEVAEMVWRERDQYLEGGRPRPERLTATMLFADMKGYTSRAEKLEAGDLMLWLNAYLEKMGDHVMEAGGLVEDYFGDGLMACFGIPIPRRDAEGVRRDAHNAVNCAIAMEETIRELNVRWRRDGFPTIGIRVGVATGPLVAGSMGSGRKLKYAVVGDAVVTAQRLQGLDDSDHDFDAEPCRILVSRPTADLVQDHVRTRQVGEVLLKGKAHPETVFRVLGPRGGTPGGSPDLG